MWEILKIEATCDIRAIKKAYSEQLRIYHPEEDPIGYQNLRQAYDQAIKYAKNSGNNSRKTIDFEDTEDLETNKDNTLDLSSIYDEELYDEGSEYDNNSLNKDYWEDDYNIDTEDEDDPLKSVNINQDYIDINIDNYHTENNEDTSTKDIIEVKMDQIMNLYKDFFNRNKIEKWKAILDSKDIVNNFDKLNELAPLVLEFVYNYDRLSSEIFKYLNRVFEWESDLIVDKKTKKKVDFILSKINNDSEQDYTVYWKNKGFDYDRYLTYRLNAKYFLDNDNLDDALSYLNLANEMYDKDPILIKYFCDYFKNTGESENGLRMVEKLMKFEDFIFEAYEYKCLFLIELERYNQVLKDSHMILSIEKIPCFYYYKAKAQYLTEQYRDAMITMHYATIEFEDNTQLREFFRTVKRALEEQGVSYEDVKIDLRRGKNSEKGNVDTSRDASTPKKFLSKIFKRKYLVVLVLVAMAAVALTLILNGYDQDPPTDLQEANNQFQQISDSPLKQ